MADRDYTDPRSAELIRAYLRIEGIVQGVFFRANMRREALKLGVKGWVKNLPNGSVEAVVEGEREAVEQLIKWALRGPPAARVTKVTVIFSEPRKEFDDFSIRY